MNSDVHAAVFDQAPVHAIVRRRGSIVRTSACLMGAAVLLAAAFAFAFLDQKFVWGETTRVWLTGIAVAGALALFIRHRWSEKRQLSAQAVVRDMEASSPAEGQLLRTAWELTTRGTPSSATEDHQAFSSQVLIAAQQKISSGGWEQLISTGRMMRWLAVCGALVAGLLVVALQWPEFRTALRRVVMPFGAPTYTSVAWQSSPVLFDDRHPPRLAVTLSGKRAVPQLQVLEAGSTDWQTHSLNALPDGRSFDTVLTGIARDFQARVIAGDGETPVHRVRYRPIPHLEEAKVTIQYPDYTGLVPDERQGGDASVVEGSTLTWQFRFNTPPDRVEWTLASGSSAPQQVPVNEDGPRASSSWTSALGKHTGVLTVYDKDGSTMDSWRYEIAGLADKMPVVELLEPVKDRQATCVTELPVRIRARDDFGVAEIGLVMQAAGKTFWILEKVFDERNERDISELTRAMLETLPLTINDNIKLYAYALDHKPRGGPRSVSALRAIDIRDFKRLVRYAPKGKAPPVNPRQFAKLNKLISLQRVVVSDTHVVKEEARDEAAEGIGTKCQEIAVKQQDVAAKTGELFTAWQAESSIPSDDVTLLGTAQAQMDETTRFLGRTLTEQAHATSDRALGSLLQLRKHLMTLVGPDCDCDSEDDAEEIKSLEELAREAERLAKEQKSVREQIVPVDKKPVVALASSRRQQEVALADGGELFSAIVTHPKKNEPMLRLMAASEREMRAADERIHTPEHLTAQKPLADAEQNLRDLADFIHAMIEEKLADALKQMASKAQGDSKKPGAKGESGSKSGDSKSDKGKAGEGKSEDATGKEPQMAAGKEAGNGDAEQAARNAELADEILKTLAQLAANGSGKEGKEGPGESAKQPGSNPGMTAADLEALRQRAGTEALAKDLRQLAKSGDKPGENGKPGPGEPAPGTKRGDEAKRDGKGIASRLEKMAKELNGEAARLNASRLAQLADVREKASKLRDKAAEEARAKQAADDQKQIERMIAQGLQPGQSFIVDGRQIVIPAKPAPGKGVEEIKSKAGEAAADIAPFVAEAQRLGDEKVNGLTRLLQTDMSPVSALAKIVERLDLLMSALPGNVIPQTAQSFVPEAHRREIEAYFRNLSDDFDHDGN